MSNDPALISVAIEYLSKDERARVDALREAAAIIWSRGCVDSSIWEQLHLYVKIAALRELLGRSVQVLKDFVPGEDLLINEIFDLLEEEPHDGN